MSAFFFQEELEKLFARELRWTEQILAVQYVLQFVSLLVGKEVEVIKKQ